MKHITGSLQIKNDKYFAVLNLYDENHKRKPKWISTGYTVKNNKRNAEKFLRDLIQEYEDEQNETVKRKSMKSSDIKFTDYIDTWLKKVKIGVSEITYRGYFWTCQSHILPYFTEKGFALSDITKNELQDYINTKYDNGRKDGNGGLSPKTLKEHKIILNLIFKSAIDDDLINNNPCASI